jgi:hypothetical protein
MALQAVFFAHVLLQHTEAARELHLLSGIEPLVAEKHHLVVEKSLSEPRKGVVVERPCEVQAANLRSQVAA